MGLRMRQRRNYLAGAVSHEIEARMHVSLFVNVSDKKTNERVGGVYLVKNL